MKEELGDNDDDEDDVVALERKMQTVGMPSNVWKHAQRELRYVRSDFTIAFFSKMQFSSRLSNLTVKKLEIVTLNSWRSFADGCERCSHNSQDMAVLARIWNYWLNCHGRLLVRNVKLI